MALWSCRTIVTRRSPQLHTSDPEARPLLLARGHPEYAAWLGDALLALDIRLCLGEISGDAFVRYTNDKTQSAYLLRVHPELERDGSGNTRGPRALSSLFEQLYWREQQFRTDYLHFCFSCDVQDPSELAPISNLSASHTKLHSFLA